jgi:hypothetical protein
VVAAVFTQVALLAAVVDLRGDHRTVGDQVIELVLEPVM